MIEAALREASRPVQHNIIAQWIEHARHLATADRFSTIEDKTLIKKALVEWQTQTVFTVEFQTRDLADSVARQIELGITPNTVKKHMRSIYAKKKPQQEPDA